MARLNKQYYYSRKNDEKKINCYHVIVPKAIVKESGIDEDDELAVYEEYGCIVIEKKYHFTCMECGYDWDSGKDYDTQTICPQCHTADISVELNGVRDEKRT